MLPFISSISPAPIKIAEKGHFLEEKMGVISQSERQ